MSVLGKRSVLKMIKYFRFIRVNDTVENNHNKVFEEFEEWTRAIGTPEEPEELVDVLNALCNLFVSKFGYSRLKAEDLKNINDVAKRYGHLIGKPTDVNINASCLWCKSYDVTCNFCRKHNKNMSNPKETSCDDWRYRI